MKMEKSDKIVLKFDNKLQDLINVAIWQSIATY